MKTAADVKTLKVQIFSSAVFVGYSINIYSKEDFFYFFLFFCFEFEILRVYTC